MGTTYSSAAFKTERLILFHHYLSTPCFKMFNFKGGKKAFDNDFKALLRQGRNSAIVALVNGTILTDLVDDTGTTLLHLSARYNNVEVTKFLISSGCNVNVTNTLGQTPLMMAASASSFKTAQILIDENADVYVTNPSNKNILQMILNNKKAPRYIIDKCFEKIKSVSRNNQELAGRLMAVECPVKLLVHLQNPDVLNLILNNSIHLDRQQAQEALNVAFRLKDQQNAKVLLKWGVSVDIKNPDSLQFLNNMFKNSNIIDMQLLILFLMRIKNWTELEESFLFFLEGIFEKATKPILEIFLYYNVDVYVRTQFPGRDLFVHLFSNRNPGVKDVLQIRGFNVNSRGERGFTALHMAVKHASVEDVKFLLSNGADANAKDKEGAQPLSMIAHTQLGEDRKVCTELLLRYGADPQSVEITGESIVEWCIKANDVSMLEPILAQIAIQQTQGALIIPKISNCIVAYQEIRVYYQSCCTQLQKLKKFLIYGSVTLFTVIAGDIEKYALRIPYPQIIESLRETASAHQWNAMYLSRIKEFFDMTLEIIALKSKASSVLRDAICTFNEEDEIVGRILNYLTYKDLLMFA